MLSAFLAERERWILWLPVGMGAGAGLYLALPVEPPALLGPGLAVAAALVAAGCRRTSGLPLAVALLALLLGFAAGQVRALGMGTDVLAQPVGPLPMTGRVAQVDRQDRGYRVVLEDLRADAPRIALPARVRIRFTVGTPPEVGSRIAVTARLQPLPPPAMPGGHDFGRDLWFAGLGAVGFAYGDHEVIEPSDAPDRLDVLRRATAARIAARLPEPAAAIATALVTGERGPIPAETEEAIRAAGLTHLLAISGLHIGLVAGLVFFVLRFLGALVEPVALRVPVKKVAAVGGLLAAVAYTAFVGAPVSAQRAAIMAGIAMVAILLDRSPISMRLVAWAAVLVLLVQPEAVASVSFQMSFAAVVALVAFYERAGPTWTALRGIGGWGSGILLHVAGVAATSVVAGIATAPFGIQHFNQFMPYGVVANLVAVPLTTFWIMPMALLACLLMPFGVEGPVLTGVGWGIESMVWVATQVAAWPGALTIVPALPWWGFLAVVLGGLWLCLWGGTWRRLGFVLIAAGAASLGSETRPDLLVNETGSLAAVRGSDGTLYLSNRRSDRFAAETWLRHNGQATAPTFADAPPDLVRCDAIGCLVELRGKRVALVRQSVAFAEDCAVADVVIATQRVPPGCRADLVLGPRDLLRGGGVALRLGPDGVQVGTITESRGRRPWVGAQ